MRILFTSFPAFGHFHPIAPLALAACRAGHAVMVASGPDLADWARACGFSAHAIGASQHDLVQTAEEQFGDDWPSHLFTDTWVSAAMPELMTLAKAWRPDAVVHEEEEYAGPLVAALLGKPCVTHSWHSPARPFDDRQSAREMMAHLWSRWAPGASPALAGEIYLDACPPALQTEHIDSIANVWSVRAVSFDGPGVVAPGWLRELARPAIYVTMGTVPVFSKALVLRQIVEAVAPLAASVVVTTGPNPVAALDGFGSNVHVAQYLPQSIVLPHVDLLVSQAGAGGTLGAIEHGIPHLMLPSFARSQIETSKRIEGLGAGLALWEGSRSDQAIRNGAAALLGEPRYRVEAVKIRAELERLPSPEAVMQRIADTLDVAGAGSFLAT